MPPNPYYDHSGFPQTNTRASSALMRAELDAVEQGFDKLPVLSGNGSEIVTVKADATGLESKTQVELHLVRDDGDTYTGAHDFTGATITAPTQSTADSSTKVATTAFVNNVAMNPALPNQAGNAGKYIQTDGTNASWATVTTPTKLKIFESAAASITGATSMEILENATYSTGMTTSNPLGICYGNGLFVCHVAGAVNTVATSPDGVTWTLRTMPSTAYWRVSTDGTNFIASVNAGSSTIAASTNGTVWTSGTSLPGNTDSTYPDIRFAGTIGCVMGAASTTTLYKTINNGTSWTTETLPVARGNGGLMSIGGLFLYWTSGTTYYTSATGSTGSWTARTLPVTTPSGFAYSSIDFDGSLLWASSVAGDYVYRTTDGINWTSTGYVFGDMVVTINGIAAAFGGSFGNAFSWHNGKKVIRSSYSSTTLLYALSSVAKSPSGVHIIPGGSASGRVLLIDQSAADAATALFQ